MEARYGRLEKNYLIPFPSKDLGQLKETALNESPEQMRMELETNGYIFIRGCIDRNEVLSAKRKVLDFMAQVNGNQTVFADKGKGILDANCGRYCIPRMEGKPAITHDSIILNVLESGELFNLFERIFGTPAKSFDFKWLRAMYMEGFTGAHMDSVYMSRGTQKTLTCWLPFDDIPVEIGGLVINEGSNRLESFEQLRSTYGTIDLDALNFKGSGWFTEDSAEILERFGGRWVTADFRAGDALIFTLKTVHMSLTNQTRYARISCDTRWYPADENPDPRYVGDLKPLETVYGDIAIENPNGMTIEKLKKQWGFL